MKILITFLLVASWMNISICQEINPSVVATSGDTYEAITMKLDWTLGEVAVTTIQNPSLQITQGFHQPAYIVTSVQDIDLDMGDIVVYPIPTADGVTIEMNLNQIRKTNIELYDLNGQLIWTQKISGQHMSLRKDLSELANGIYFLKFGIEKNQVSRTFKIEKLK